MSVTAQRLDPGALSTDFLSQWGLLAQTPMQSPEWMLRWWDEFQSPNCSPTILAIEDDSKLIGIAPLMMRHCWSFGRVIRFLGSGAACSDFQTLLAADGQETVVANTVADWLISGMGCNTWDLIELDGVSQHTPAVEHLLSRLAEHKTIQQTTQHENTWRLDVSGGWDGFCKNMSKSQRAQTRNLMNRFDNNDRLQFRVANDRGQLAIAYEACVELHQRRWTAVGEAGCFANSRFTSFLRRALDALAESGSSQIAVLEQDGRPVATQIILQDTARNRYIYQSGRDPQFDSERVGQILTLKSIRHACDNGAAFVDYLRGDEIYKQRLKAEPTACYRIRVFAPGKLPSLRYNAWKFGRELKVRATALGKLIAGGTPLVKDKAAAGAGDSSITAG